MNSTVLVDVDGSFDERFDERLQVLSSSLSKNERTSARQQVATMLDGKSFGVGCIDESAEPRQEMLGRDHRIGQERDLVGLYLNRFGDLLENSEQTAHDTVVLHRDRKTADQPARLSTHRTTT